MKYKKAEKAIYLIIIVLLFAMAALVLLEDYHLYFYYKMKPRASLWHSYLSIPDNIPAQLDRREYMRVAAEEFDVHCLVIYKDSSIFLKNEHRANSNPLIHTMWLSTELVENHYSNYEFEIAYTHELMHIKYQTLNEAYTTYMTAVNLIESDNDYLHFIGIIYSNQILKGGYKDTDSDCSAELLDYYLKNHLEARVIVNIGRRLNA